MRASVSGRQELAARVQYALALPTKKEAEMVTMPWSLRWKPRC